MIIRRHWLAMAIVGVLAVVGVIVAQTKKSKSGQSALLKAQTIHVDGSAACVDVEDMVGYTLGNAATSDTIGWQISSNNVTDFHVIFIKKSPSHGNELHFGQNDIFTVKYNPVNGTEVFDYVIWVKMANGTHNSCDPHVIVVHGSGNDAR